ncbi:unnamed protein product [Penicillium viridicatum]
MRFALALLCVTLASALPSELGGDKQKGGGDSWEGPKDNSVKVVGSGKGGVGGSAGSIGVGTGGGGGGNCDPVACDIKCKKLGNQSGYCDTSGSSDLLGLDVLNENTSGCICVPNTSSCTTTTTVTSTGTATATNTVTATDTATATVTNTNTITSTNTISTTTTATYTTTATSCPTNVACFCCTRQTQLDQRFLTGTCDIISAGTNCPVGNGQGRRWKVCCNGDGQCTQTEQ